MVTVRLAPHRLSLGFHTADTAQNDNSAIEDAKRALHFRGEVNVSGRVDKGDEVVLPLEADGGSGDGDPASLLLLHPVRDGSPFVHFAHLVRLAGAVEQPLRHGRLSGIDMSHDADVSALLK